jgi:hypothetical protein
MKLIFTVAVLTAFLHSQASSVSLRFSPESERFADATKEYQRIWQAEGNKMIQALEGVSGLKFGNQGIQVIIFEGASNSGFGDKPMKLRASYSPDIKKATLVHELGHRLNAQIKNRPDEIDEHRILFLYLYDVWIKLYGKSFADEAVEVEKQRKGLYDYEGAWKWALALSEKDRAARLRAIIGKR